MTDDRIYTNTYIHTCIYIICAHMGSAHNVYTQRSSLTYTMSLGQGGSMGRHRRKMEKNNVDGADETSYTF